VRDAFGGVATTLRAEVADGRKAFAGGEDITPVLGVIHFCDGS
jgi:hypothetical protein